MGTSSIFYFWKMKLQSNGLHTYDIWQLEIDNTYLNRVVTASKTIQLGKHVLCYKFQYMPKEVYGKSADRKQKKISMGMVSSVQGYVATRTS